MRKRKPAPKKTIHQKPFSQKKKKQTLITTLSLTGAFLIFLCLFGIYSEKKKTTRIQAVNKESYSTKGIITWLRYSKGHSIRVKFLVKGKEFEYEGGWDKNPLNLGEGDSIHLRYATSNPTLAITELENEF